MRALRDRRRNEKAPGEVVAGAFASPDNLEGSPRAR
jgi:hypothetical protein